LLVTICHEVASSPARVAAAGELFDQVVRPEFRY
jgi:hypothetical protein